jgi:hypothetical protein
MRNTPSQQSSSEVDEERLQKERMGGLKETLDEREIGGPTLFFLCRCSQRCS